jgi:hypothetical protein
MIMKSIKNIALSAMLTFGAFAAVTYTACTKDDCKDVVCNNGGTCSGGSCVCPTGYEGTNCDTKSFLGSWKGSDVCSSGTYNNITIEVNTATTAPNDVIVTNPGGFGASVTVTGTMSTDAKTITISSQSVGGGRTLSGTMTLTSPTTFTFSYTASDATTNDVCNGQYTKQ